MHMCVCRFPNLFSFSSSPLELCNLEDKFLSYQLLKGFDIPDSVWQTALVVEKNEKHYYRMDIIWAYLETVKYANSSLAFQKLADVVFLVLTLLHSKAEEEEVFSLIMKNKTKFRPNLSLDGTLSSVCIITIKLASSTPCSKFELDKEVLESARKATMAYYYAHSSKHVQL